MAAVLLASLWSAACWIPAGRARGSSAGAVATVEEHALELDRLERKHLTFPEDRALFMDAARSAWAYMDPRFQQATGLITANGDYPYVTLWDIGGILAALYSAHGLGLVDDITYHARVQRILDTLGRLQLYDNAALNKSYDARTGARAGSGDASTGQGAGWSPTDLGRLFVWLRIVGADSRYKDAAETIVKRHDLSRIVKHGYLWGEDMSPRGRRKVYQEGRIGYEQYAAQGFALWGAHPDKALSLTENALPVTVMGQPVVADVRRHDRLMNEPFLLYGLEVGWDPPMRRLSRRLLLAQEARYKKTGLVTVTGEDSIDVPPHYFYYYCLYSDGKGFTVDVQDRRATVDGPRWVSAKSAFAFHALMPTAYTEVAVKAATHANTAAGWASGVYEGTGTSTGSVNLNTAAVILTAALVNHRGEPVLAQARARSGE